MKGIGKIVSATLCAVFVIAGGVIGTSANNGGTGAGNGSNAKIEKLETLQTLLESIDDSRSNRSTYALTQNTLAETEDGSTEEPAPKKEYTSCTFTEISNAYVTSKDSNTVFSRTLRIYFGEDGNYYESDGQLTSSSTREGDRTSYSTKSTLDFQMKIYMSSDCVMYYVSRLNYTFLETYENRENSERNYRHTEKDTAQGKLYSAMREYGNRWIDCTDEPSVATAFLSVDSGNLKTLSSFATLIREQTAQEENDLKKNGNLYTLKENALLDFFGLSSFKETYKKYAKIKGSCSIDLRKKTEPQINYTLSADIKESEYTNQVYSYVDDAMSFQNINNTVVKKPKGSTTSVQAIIDRMEEMGEEE